MQDKVCKMFCRAAKRGDLVKLTEIFEAHRDIDISHEIKKAYSIARENNRLNIISFLDSEDTEGKEIDKHFAAAVKEGQLDLVKHYHETWDLGVILSPPVLDIAMVKGRYRVAKYLTEITIEANTYPIDDLCIPGAMQGGHLNIVKYLHSKAESVKINLSKINISDPHYHVLNYFRDKITGSILDDPIAASRYQDAEGKLLRCVSPLVHEVSLRDIAVYHTLSHNFKGLILLKLSLKKDATADKINVLPTDIQNLILKKFNAKYDDSLYDFKLALTLNFPTKKEIDDVKLDCSTMAKVWIALLEKNQQSDLKKVLS